MHKIQFYRPARSYPPVLPKDELKMNAPPVLQANQGGVIGWLQYLLPVVGGIGSLIFVLAFRENPWMLVAGIAMAVSFIGSGVLMGFVQRYNQKRQRKHARNSYLEYLTHMRLRLKSLAEKQRLVAMRLYPDYKKLEQLVEKHTYLWERRPDDDDFLTVRIGLMAVPLSCRVSLDFNNDVTTQYIPELRAQAEALLAEWRYLHDMPALIPLRSIGVLAIHGKRAQSRALVHALLSQVVAFHSPEDVRCMVYFPQESSAEWSWLKWVPHVRRLRLVKTERLDAPDHVCMLADTAEDVNDLLLHQIGPELERRRKFREDKQAYQATSAQMTLPHFFIIFDSFSPFSEAGRLPELETLLHDAAQFGVTVICLVENQRHEPAQVQARISIAPSGTIEYAEMKLGGQRSEGVIPDLVDPRIYERIARTLAPLSLVEAGAQQDLAHDIRLLDLLKIPSADAFTVAQAWRARGRSELLRVPLGVRADGEPLLIDLKEAAEGGMGPHGLVIGATGSGKSELLRTLITSLAVTHDPETVNFVLIDFKGGASFADFAALPHVAGVITNLAADLSQIDRVYYSLLGEQQRRQRMLHDAGNLDNIKQYRARQQMNSDMQPMPHLVIIADEFAELMTHRPEFLDLFITMGRIGRSLGLYLLFATQRLEEGRIRGLESHLRYRICLRTFSAEESRTVLETRDAYYLPSVPGVGYFKVDTNIYHLFKTALISVPYAPVQEAVTLQSKIRTFTSTGKLVKQQSAVSALPAPEAEQVEAVAPSDLHTEMDVVIERLAHTVMPESQHAVHQVCLPALPKHLPLSTILQACHYPELDRQTFPEQSPFGTLRVPVGLVDMPLQQAQEPFFLDFSGTGGHLALVGAPQAGKSTFLRTLVTTFLLTHSPRNVQFYCIDMGGGLLRVFEQAPHVGAVCSKAERDKLIRTVRQVRKVVEDREFLFREHGIDSMATFRARRQDGAFADFPFGDVFLIIDNFALFQQEFEQLDDDITALVASGLTYGVHVVIAANRWLEIRNKIRDNIGTRLELRLNDPLDSEFGKAVAATVPVSVPGRGVNAEKLQFQVSLPLLASSPAQESTTVQEFLETVIQQARTHWRSMTTPPVRLLPALVDWQDLLSATRTNRHPGVPIGLEEFRLEPISVDLIGESPHFMVLGDSESGKTTLLRTWMRGIEQRYSRQEVVFAIVDYRKTLVDFAESKNLLSYAYNTDTLTSCIDTFRVDFEKRVKADGNVPLSRVGVRKHWTGQHYFLFVDDYDAIVSSNSIALNPLVDFLSVGRDIGFHLVITRRVSGFGRATYESVVRQLSDMGVPALILSGNPQEGRIIHNQAAALLPPGRGYLARRNSPSTLIQVAYAEPAYALE